MASRGDHQGPWVRHVSALLLLGRGTRTSGSITKNKDLGKKAARKHGAKPLGEGWKEPKRAEADRAGHVQGEKQLHQLPTSTQLTACGEPTEEGNAMVGCAVSILQNLPAKASVPGRVPPLSQGCSAQGTAEKDSPPSQRREPKAPSHAQDTFPSSLQEF